MKIFSLYYFFYYLALASFIPYVSLFMSERGISFTRIGVIFSLWALVSVISQPVMGIVSDRLHDRRILLMIATIISPVAAFGFYFFDSFTALIVLSVIFPWFQSSIGPLSDSMAVEVGAKNGFSFGRIRLWGALSYAISSFVTGFVYKKTGYDKSFFVYFVITAFVFLILLFFPKDDTSFRKRISLFDQGKQVFYNKPFMVFSGICLLLTMSASMNYSFLPIHFTNRGYDKSWIGVANAAAALIEVPMFWVSAKLNRKFGGFTVLGAAAFLYAVKYIVFSMSHNVYATIAVQLLDGISFAFFASNSVEIVDAFSSAETKATFQTMFAAITYGLGGIVGSACGGIIVDHLGTSVLYFTLFVLCLFGFSFLLVARTTSGVPKQFSQRS